MKLATANVIKIFILCFIILFSVEYDDEQQETIKIGQVTNEIRLGQFTGNRNLSVGVKNILEDQLFDLDYDLSDDATTQINVKLVFFDIKNIGRNIGIYHNNKTVTQIIAQGELIVNGKVKKKTTQKGESEEIAVSTLIVASDGTFNQQTASIALKRVCENIIKDLLK